MMNMGKFKRYLLGLGIFITVVGIASTTEEIYGCLLCPIDSILYFKGLTSEETFYFVRDYWWYTFGIGLFVTLSALALFAVSKESVFKYINFKHLKLNIWRKRRMFFHGFIYILIVCHITLVFFGITQLKSFCPRSTCDLIIHGQFGVASVFWLIMLLMVFIWGRGLCGWLCVFAPVQEQAVNLLKICGFYPGKTNPRQVMLKRIFAGLLWSSLLYNVFKHSHNLSYDAAYGYKVASYGVFIGGVLTMIPLTMFITYFLGSRWFCRYLCPIGGTFSLYSRVSLLKIEIDKSKCTNCNACIKKCQMSVNINKYTNGNGINVSDGNCILCGDCIDNCPQKALHFSFCSFLKTGNSIWDFGSVQKYRLFNQNRANGS